MKKLRARLRDVIRKEMEQDPAHDVLHLDRVWANAHRISKDEGDIDLRVLLAAAYLHDLVNLPKDHPDRKKASTLSAEKAEPILAKLGYSEVEIKAAQHAVQAHSYSAGIEPKTREAIILRDADRLDALGAVGIARTFMVAGQMDRPLADPIDPFAANRKLDDQLWSIDHWHLKLLQLPAEMRTRKGKKIARKRAKLMLAYLEQLAREMDTYLPDHWSDLLQ